MEFSLRAWRFRVWGRVVERFWRCGFDIGSFVDFLWTFGGCDGVNFRFKVLVMRRDGLVGRSVGDSRCLGFGLVGWFVWVTMVA